MSQLLDRVGPKDIRAFHKSVQDLIMSAVNEHGTRYRMNGGHLWLYNGDREVQPIKVSRERPVASQVKHLLSWLEANVSTWKEREVVQPVTPKDVAEVAAKLDKVSPPVKSDWQPLGSTKEYAQMFEQSTVGDTTVYRCKTCKKKFPKTQGLWMHWQGHTDPEAQREAAKKANAAWHAKHTVQKEAEASTALDKDPEGETIAIEDATPEEIEMVDKAVDSIQEEQDLLVLHALSVLASRHGHSVIPKGTAEMFADQERQIEELSTTNKGLSDELAEANRLLAEVIRERDDALTRLTMLQEQVNNMLQAFQA